MLRLPASFSHPSPTEVIRPICPTFMSPSLGPKSGRFIGVVLLSAPLPPYARHGSHHRATPQVRQPKHSDGRLDTPKEWGSVGTPILWWLAVGTATANYNCGWERVSVNGTFSFS